jgi:hypothetical protein
MWWRATGFAHNIAIGLGLLAILFVVMTPWLGGTNSGPGWTALLLGLLMASLGICFMEYGKWTRQEVDAQAKKSGILVGSFGWLTARGGRHLEDHDTELTGSPSYVLRTHQGVVPVKVCVSRSHGRLADDHRLAAQAYIFLMQRAGYGVPYAIVSYSDGHYMVDAKGATEAVQKALASYRSGSKKRNHDDAERCRTCPIECTQRLAAPIVSS